MTGQSDLLGDLASDLSRWSGQGEEPGSTAQISVRIVHG
jgi:hypothetical protein